MRISSGSMDAVKLLFLDLDYEVCGFLTKYKEGVLQVVLDQKGNKGECKLSRYEKNIWHTHPKVSKAYLGSSDVLQVLKKHRGTDFPVRSLIFTSWGIWEVYSEKKFELSKENITFITDLINSNMKTVYKLSERGRGFLSPLIFQELQNGISNIVSTLREKMDIQLGISFQDWRTVQGDYKLKF